MKKWQEIILNGMMNVSVVLFGTGIFSLAIGDKKLIDAIYPILIGLYSIFLTSLLAYYLEEKNE